MANKAGVSSSNSSLTIIPYFDIKEKRKKYSYKSNNPIKLRKKSKLPEINGIVTEKGNDLMISVKYTRTRYSIYEDIENICKNFLQSKVSLSDITLLIFPCLNNFNVFLL